MVRTSDSHSGNRGSIPLGTTHKKRYILRYIFFFILKDFVIFIHIFLGNYQLLIIDKI